MDVKKYIAQKAQQASKTANNSTGVSGAVSDYVAKRAEAQKAAFDERNKNRSAERAAMEAAGDRAVLDFIKSVSQPEQPKTTQLQHVPTLSGTGKKQTVPARNAMNVTDLPGYNQPQTSDQLKREQAMIDMTAGYQKLLQTESAAKKYQEKGQRLQTQSAALEQSRKNIMALKQKYEQTGDEVSGRAYLLAVEMYNQHVNAYQKEVEAYSKDSKVLADYEKAWQDLQLKQMAYQDIEDQIAAKKPENKPAEELRGMIDDLDKQIMAAEQKVAPLRQKTITKNGRDLTPENQQAQMQLQQVYAELQGLKQQKENLQGYLERRESLDWESSKEQEILEAGGEELMAALIDYAQEIELGQRFTFDKGVAAAAKVLKDMGVTDEQLQKWMPYARRMVSAETYEQQTGLAKEIAQSSRLGEAAMSVASVPYNLTGGLGIVDVTLQKLQQKLTGSDAPINYKSRGMTGYGIADAIRTGVTENIEARTKGKAGSNTALGNLHTGAYNLVMSMADSLGVVGLTAMGVPGATLLLGGSAATATMQEVKERGGTDAQALTMGWLAGAAETLFEKVSLDSLIKTKTPDSWKTAIGNILKQGLTEGSEEVSTSLANSLAEMIVMGNRSQLKTMVRQFREQGMTQEQAEKKAKEQWLVGLVADFIGGAVSGGLFGAGGNITTAMQNRGQNQKDVKKEAAAPFKTGAVENGEPGGEAPSAESVSENVDSVNKNVDAVVEDNKNVIKQEEQIATEPAAPSNDNASEGIQWAGNTPETEAERVVNNERAEQQADLGQSGNQGRNTGYSDGIGGQSPKRAAARAALDRAEEARRVQSNVYAVGGRLTSLQEEGLTEGSQDQILTTVERDAWTPEVEEAAEIAAGEGLEFVPLMGNMQVLAPNGKSVAITGAIKNGKIYARADSTRQSIREIVLHESFHERQRKDPGLVKRIKKKIQETYTREETQAMFERYADLYQDAFADLTDRELQNAIWEEMLADAYAEFQRYSDTFGTAAWSTDVQDQIWSGGEEYGREESSETKLSFAGERAKTVDPEAKARAKLMEQNGEDPEDIFAETGWFRGMDGMWRFEIDDSQMTYRKGGDAAFRKRHPDYAEYRELELRWINEVGSDTWTAEDQARLDELKEIWGSEPRRLYNSVSGGLATLDDILEHDDLFAAYPGLENVRVEFRTLPEGTKGVFRAENNQIVLDESLRNAPEKTLIHEIQHAIQQIEGMAGGASVGYWQRRINSGFELRKFERRAKAAEEEYRALFDGAPEALKDMVRKINQAKLREDWDTVLEIEDQLYEGEYSDLYSKLEMADFVRREDWGERLTARDLYENTAGEIEARDAASRRNLSAETRRDILPKVDEENVVFADDNRFGLEETKQSDLYQNANLADDAALYDYDFLVSQKDMKVVKLPEVPDVRNLEGKVDTRKVVEEGMKNARSVGTEQGGKVYVENVYTGRDLRVDVQSIRHGMNGSENRKLTNARMGYVIGDIVKNAIPINGLRNDVDYVNGTYAMAAYTTDSRGREFVAIVTVEQRNDGIAGFDLYDVTHAVSGRQKRTGSQADTKSQGVNPIKAADVISISDLLDIVNETHQSILSESVLQALGEKRNPEGDYADRVKFSANGERDIRAELADKIKPGLPNGPHAVSGVVREVTGHLERPEGMSDEEYAELDAKWQERNRSDRDTQGMTPVEELIVPKTAFTSTPAMDKLGIKIDGSVTRYRQTEHLRAYEKAAKQAQNMLLKRIKALNPTEQEKFLARSLVDGNITASVLDDDNVSVSVITELADYMMAARSFSDDMIRQRRSEINTANLRIAEDLFEDAEAYNPKLKKFPGLTKIVMNERTPERVVKQIFGQEQGQKIYETYFRPVWVNGAEMNRFENRMLDRVAKFEDKNGAKRSLTEEERAMAQRLMEGEAARDNVARLDADTRERVESAAQNVNNGEEFVDAIREFGLAEEYHQGLVQAYADYLDTVTMSKDMDQTILKNAITTYQQIYNEMYDAINDFLVSHGYSEIGFIKGYAPHFQKRDAQQGLFGALKALGVEKESVSELPASIAGRTADFKPNMKWNPHMQGRKGNSTSYDIQMGYEQYLHYAAEMFYHTDDVMRVRQAVNWFRGQYSGEDISMAIEDAQVDRYKSAEWKQDFLEQKGIVEVGRKLDPKTINQLYDKYVSDLYERATPENLQKYSEFVTWLDNYANIVAGKQSLADRGLEYGGGRNALNLGSRLMRAFSSANVAGNLSSVLNQSAQLPLIQQQLGTYLERAIFDMARGGIAKDNFVERSDFLTDKRGVDKLTVDGIEKYVSALFKPAELMDRMVSTLAVRGRYLQALSEGMSMEDAMKAADDFGRRVMGSRMKGAKPLGFESKTFVNQMLHVFQVEAANTFDYMLMSDMPQELKQIYKEKGKGAAARYTAAYAMGYLVNAFILNLLTDKLYGGSPAPFDLMGWGLNFAASLVGRTNEEFLKTLIDAVWERLFGERPFETEELKTERGLNWAGAAKNLEYNALNDVPYVRNIMGLMGWGDQTLPTVGVNELADHLTSAGGTLLKQAFLGEEETGISWAGAARESAEDLLSAAAMVAPGGRQLKKTIQGMMTVAQGGRYYGDRLQYPVDRSVWNAIQAGLFGPSALEAADAYYAAEMSSLTAGQTKKVEELEAMGVDRFATYDLYQKFREINKDLTGAEASTAKRNAINNMDLTDQEKLEVYSTFIMDRASESYGKNREQFQAMLDAGLTWDEVTQAHNLQATLNEDEDLKATERATEFAKWVDQQGWNKKQEAAVKEKFKFWQMIPAQAATYEKLEEAGVDPKKAADLTKNLADLQPEDGKEMVTTNQKVLAIDRSKLSDEEKVAAISTLVPDKRERLVEAGVSDRNARDMAAELAIAEAENGDEELTYLQKASMMIYQASDDEEALAAVSTVLQESTYQKVELANSYGVPVEYWVDYREAWQAEYGEDSVSQEKVEDVLDKMMLLDSQKAVLWQIANKSWKPKNNPYDRWIGEEIYDELNEE